MIPRFLCLLVGVAALPLLSACEDLQPLQQQALQSVAAVETSIQKIDQQASALEPRLGALPTDLPGVTEAQAQLGAVRARVAKVRSLTEALPSRIEVAARAGHKEELLQLTGEGAAEVASNLSLISEALDNLGRSVSELELAARSRAPAP